MAGTPNTGSPTMDSPLQVTVTPGACPWGFNTASRSPTPSEQLAHDLCMMQSSRIAAGDRFSAALHVYIDDVLVLGRWLLDAIESGLEALLGPEIRAVTDAVDKAYNWIAKEIGALEPWMIAAVALAIAAYFSR